MAQKKMITRAELAQAMISNLHALPHLARQHIDGDHLMWYTDKICADLGFTSTTETETDITKENID